MIYLALDFTFQIKPKTLLALWKMYVSFNKPFGFSSPKQFRVWISFPTVDGTCENFAEGEIGTLITVN